MNKIVLTSSAMWLFDVIKNVMSSNVPKKWIQKLSKAHKAKVTVTFLKEQNIQVLAHPPYSPNLAPRDIWLLLLLLSLNREGRWGTTVDFATSFFLSIVPCSPLPSGTYRTPDLSIPWCCLPTSSSVCLVFFPLSLRLARWIWPDLMNGRLKHTTAVCVSLRLSGGLGVVQLPAGSWHGSPRW